MDQFWFGVLISIITHTLWEISKVIFNDNTKAKRASIKRIVLIRLTGLAFVRFLLLTLYLGEDFKRYILQWIFVGFYLGVYAIANGGIER